jgi:serine/threonine protein kinase
MLDAHTVLCRLCPLQELHMYKQLKHPHIVGYIDARFDMATNTLYIFLENVPGGSIASMLQRFGGPFPENVARNYTRQLLLGLEYLHSQL